jgi:nucleoside recognition membrane protein YjiH
MDYVKGILSGLAAIFIAEFAFFWPLLRGSKATGLAALAALFVESIFSPRFWIVGVLLFGLFFAASRSSSILRVLFFWIPTLVVSALGFAFLGMCTYLFMRFRHQ